MPGYFFLSREEKQGHLVGKIGSEPAIFQHNAERLQVFYMLAMQAYKKPATFQHYAKDCRAATNLPNGKPPFKIKYFNYENIVLLPNRKPADQPHSSKSSLIPPWDDFL